jgi:hypothetical protein
MGSKSLNFMVKELRKSRGEKRVTPPNRMIKLQLNFWVDGIATKRQNIVPGACWDSGTIEILKNNAHGVSGSRSIPFNSLSELETKIEKGLENAGLKLVKSERHRPVYYP